MFRTLLFLLAAAIAALAETPSSPSAKGGPRVRFVAERAPGDLGQVALAAKDVKTKPFDLPVNHLSDPQVPPQRVFSLWAMAKNASLATVALSEKGDEFIVLLVPPPGGTGYAPVVIPAKDAAFAPGDYYFYNHSGRVVMGYVGTSKFSLQPGKGGIVRPTGATGGNRYYEIGLGSREKEGDRQLSLARWPVQKDIRTYVFFFDNPTTGRADFRALDEFVEPEQ